jgi:hypothetical protein
MAEKLTVWEDALDRLHITWCQGLGCGLGSTDQHDRGFVSFEPGTVHLSYAPSEGASDRENLHAKLQLVGRASVDVLFPELDQRVRSRAAFDFATDEMRAHGHSVAKAVTDLRPGLDADVEVPALFDGPTPSADQEDDG